MPPPQCIGVGLPKLQAPLPNRFIGHDNPRWARSSSTSRKLSEKRKYSHTA
jgi:hypothetical protein